MKKIKPAPGPAFGDQVCEGSGGMAQVLRRLGEER